MPLSEYEQRVLAEMERDLASGDPELASTLSAVQSPAAANRRQRVAIGLTAGLVGLALLVTGMASGRLWLSPIGFIVMFGGAYLAFTVPKPKGPKPAKPAGSGRRSGPSTPPPRSSFADRMERRWDKRRDSDR